MFFEGKWTVELLATGVTVQPIVIYFKVTVQLLYSSVNFIVQVAFKVASSGFISCMYMGLVFMGFYPNCAEDKFSNSSVFGGGFRS